MITPPAKAGSFPTRGEIMETNVTLCSIMLNEESFLPIFLENIKDIFQEYVFVDGGSTDRSVEFVEQAGYKVHQIPFKMDFSEQKNNALNLARTKWRMVMDIDETMSKGMRLVMQLLVGSSKLEGHVVSFFRDNYLDGISLDDYPLDFQVRLFDDSVYFQRPVHEIPYYPDKTVVKFFAGRLYHKKDSFRQYRNNLIYELILRGVREIPPMGEGIFNENGRLRKVKLWPGRKIEVLNEYLEGEILNK